MQCRSTCGYVAIAFVCTSWDLVDIEDQLQDRMLSCWQTSLERFGLKMNSTKTEPLVRSRAGGQRSSEIWSVTSWIKLRLLFKTESMQAGWSGDKSVKCWMIEGCQSSWKLIFIRRWWSRLWRMKRSAGHWRRGMRGDWKWRRCVCWGEFESDAGG